MVLAGVAMVLRVSLLLPELLILYLVTPWQFPRLSGGVHVVTSVSVLHFLTRDVWGVVTRWGGGA